MSGQSSPNSDRNHGRGLVLVGYRGTGKSSVGRILADRTDRPFIDSDVQLELRAGRPIASIFAESGEAVFRDWEERIIHETTSADNGAVLATGGGAVLRETNRNRLRAFGLVIWLQGSPEVLTSRLCADPKALADRPALTSAGTLREIAEVLEARLPLYRATADFEVETEGKSPEQVAEMILEICRRSPNA